MKGKMLIDQFHLMEEKHSLFDLDQTVPYWDILRYSVYVKYYYTLSSQSKIKNHYTKHKFKNYIVLLFSIIKLFYFVLFKKYDNLILTSSRYYDKDTNKYYDISAAPFIAIGGKTIYALEMVLDKKLNYPHLCDLSNIIVKFLKGKSLPYGIYRKIETAVNLVLDDNRLSYDDLNYVYKVYCAELKFYTFLLKKLQVKNVIICKGNPKAIIMACHNLNISTTLVQHASIERDEVDYSYPFNISWENKNILFPDNIATFGSYWCVNINVPAKNIINIGNNEMCNIPDVESDNSILIISTIIHGSELKFSTREIALAYPERKINYKLHPNEYHLKSEYEDFFSDLLNVTVIDIEESTKVLVAKSALVVAIVSAVVYDALHQGKLVAIFKRINYKRQECIIDNPNVFMYDTIEEFVKKYSSIRPSEFSLSYYENQKNDIIRSLIC